jgi:hypothetical protein
MTTETPDYLTFAQAARTLPGKPAPSTIWRWARHGCNGVKLATLMIGGRRYVTRQAIQEFIAATTAAADLALDSEVGERSPELAKRLEAAGVLT